MICVRLTIVVLLGALSSVLASAQIASESELAATSARGRALYEYDQAAWHATDAVQALNLPRELLGRYIARKTDAGWEVAFGRLNEAKDAFLIAAMATQGSTLQQFAVRRLDPVQADSGFYLAAALALETAIPAFHGAATGRTYNASVLPAPNSQWFVYLEPGQIDADREYFPLGSDIRYLISEDGKRIIESRQMHRSLIPWAEIPAGATLAGGAHSHVLSDMPEDSDVFVVLSRKPAIPEYIATESAVYAVNTDGSIVVQKRNKKRR